MPDAHTYRRSDTMAVRADHLAFGDLAFSLSNALGVADVERLAGVDVIKFKRDRVRLEPAVRASGVDFVGVQPVANARCTLVRLPVDGFTVPRGREPRFSPLLDALGRKLPLRSRTFSASVRAEPGVTLRRESSTALLTGERSKLRPIPRRHLIAVPSVGSTCKPDIFAATYDAVDKDWHKVAAGAMGAG